MKKSGLAPTRGLSEGKKLALLTLPFVILTFLFSYFPLYGWVYALYDYRAPLKLSYHQLYQLQRTE